MEAKEKVLATMKEAGTPLNAGKIAQSIRTVMRAVANRKDKKVTVEFIG